MTSQWLTHYKKHSQKQFMNEKLICYMCTHSQLFKAMIILANEPLQIKCKSNFIVIAQTDRRINDDSS